MYTLMPFPSFMRDDNKRRSGSPNEGCMHVRMCAVGGIYGDCKPTDACRCCNSTHVRTHTHTQLHNPPHLLQCASSSYHISTGRQKKDEEEKEHCRIHKEGRKTQIIE